MPSSTQLMIASLLLKKIRAISATVEIQVRQQASRQEQDLIGTFYHLKVLEPTNVPQNLTGND